MQDRRRDRDTANTITEAIRMKTAFGTFAAHQFLRRRNIPIVTAARAIADRHDPRQQPS